ncbi:hypothetical protein [Neopusillimonas maritima]|uniref:Uncharacterized protein n=1 Tax=Neopusillimonas maritima TaxID=2026239 RepID=A0A3A1YWT5_9BURK|nr:hypothetical protein [Neopusillimonas maritima]RIY41981.1 hypothetical protein CJP73_00605 [Neopusillimonas maritima]
MTTEAAAALYEAQHIYQMQGRPIAIYNPHDKPVSDLPVIYGFNNGGRPGWFSGALISQDGKWLGGHLCSSEAYMPHDLGILEGSRPDRHEEFKEHYPDGYRMEFVGYDDVLSHEGIKKAAELADEKEKQATSQSKG